VRRCADHAGYSLHAGVWISGQRRRQLERLVRYVGRPPLGQERLSYDSRTGKVLYAFKRPFKDGSTHVMLDPLTFLSRLASLVPPPRMHLVTYHGVLAPSARNRELIVPVTLPGRTRQSGKCEHGGAEVQQGAGREQALAGAVRSVVHPDRQYETQPQPQSDVPLEGAGLRRRYSWAELFKRVFLEDVLVCHRCGGRRKVLSFILDTDVIIKILTHLGLPTEPPLVHPARASPEAGGLDLLE
jgi:hypothetical protein